MKATDWAASPAEWNDWRWHIRNRVRSAGELIRVLGLPDSAGSLSWGLLERYPLGVTPYYLSLIEPGDLDDPILRQVLPLELEAGHHAEESADPFEEQMLSPVPGVVHRYRDRALIVPTNYCATLCRHCFRKRSWQQGFFMLNGKALREAVEYVRRTPSIRDVVVTGGDPLHLPPRLIDVLLNELRTIPHLEVLRVASRLPATLPQRLDTELIELLRSVRPMWLITQFNHAREVSEAAEICLRLLLDAGITVQNQAVLLRGINDSAEAQMELSRALLRVGVRPYYLHVADPVAGTGHFRVPLDEGKAIVRSMFGKIAGLGIPRLVVDLPGGRGKVPVMPDFVVRNEGPKLIFESPIDGGEVGYRPAREEP